MLFRSETQGHGIVDISVRSDIAGPLDPRDLAILGSWSQAQVAEAPPMFDDDSEEM